MRRKRILSLALAAAVTAAVVLALMYLATTVPCYPREAPIVLRGDC